MKFFTLVNPFFLFITINQFVWSMPRSREEKIWTKYIPFNLFLLQNYVPLGQGSWHLQFCVSIPYRYCKKNLVKNCLYSIWEENIQDDEGRRNQTHNNRYKTISNFNLMMRITKQCRWYIKQIFSWIFFWSIEKMWGLFVITTLIWCIGGDKIQLQLSGNKLPSTLIDF